MERTIRATRSAASKRPSFDRRKMVLGFSQSISSSLPAANRIVSRILRQAERMKCGESEMDRVELALREALTNAIVHGNLRDPRKRVRVRCYCQADCGLLLVVDDEGAGFNPKEIPDPTRGRNIYSSHGRGIYLMRRLMDQVRFERSGSRVVLKRRWRR
jgi:serine/threonine-protein kinase RsbW